MSRVAVDAATSLAGSTSVDLVVVHCREPLGWLTEVRAGLLETAPGASLRLFVYEKCGDTVPLPWSEATDGPLGRVQLPNRGEECLGYLTYLIARYHALPDYSVFFQGDGVLGGRASRTKACAFGARVARRETGVFRTVNDHQYISLAASKEACAADASLVNCNEGGPGQWRCLSELVVRHGIGVPAAGYATYANAQFGVSRDKITDRPLRFYQGLLDEFGVAPEAECYRVTWGKGKDRSFRGTCALLEMLWHTVLGEPARLAGDATMSGVVAAPLQMRLGAVR